MRDLFRVEVTRLRWRRAVLALVALAFVVTAVAFAAEAYQTRPVSDAEVTQALTRPEVAHEVHQCERNPQQFYGLDGSGQCAKTIVAQLDGRDSLRLDQAQSDVLTGVITLVALLMVLVGTTFAGHDWGTGSMSNQLLFDPRRGRVWTAKGTAVTLLALLLSAVVFTGYWLAIYGLARERGLYTAGALGDGLAQVARSTALVGGVALGSYALAMLLRSTVATLAVLFAVVVVGGILFAVLGGEDSQPWQPQDNVAAVVSNDYVYYTHDDCSHGNRFGSADQGFYEGSGDGFAGCEVTHHLHAAQGGPYTGVILLLTVGLSVTGFRRRDLP